MLDDSKGVMTDLSGRTDITQHEVNLNTSDQIRNKPYQKPVRSKRGSSQTNSRFVWSTPVWCFFCEEGWLRFVSIFSYIKMRTPPLPPCGLFLPSGIKIWVNLHLLYLRMLLHNLQLFSANWFSRNFLKYIYKISIILN